MSTNVSPDVIFVNYFILVKIQSSEVDILYPNQIT